MLPLENVIARCENVLVQGENVVVRRENVLVQGENFVVRRENVLVRGENHPAGCESGVHGTTADARLIKNNLSQLHSGQQKQER